MIKKTFFYLCFISSIAFLYVTCSDVQSTQTYAGKVIKVIDGDTIDILYDGKPLRIRLAEIDTPERGQPYWKKSRDALADYVAGKVVTVEKVDIDRWDRVIGQVYLDSLWINGELVRIGFAYVYPKYATSQRLYEYEQLAKESQVGIWVLAESEREKPWVWRRKKY